jgi:hypothetical protein
MNFYFFIFEQYQLTVHKITNIYKLLLKIFKFFFYKAFILELLWFIYFFLYYYLFKKFLIYDNFSFFIFFIILSKPFFYNFFIFYPVRLIKFTLLRSSFVHKTTREQFEYLIKSIFFRFYLIFDNIWLNNYFFFTKNFFKFNKKKIAYINILLFKKQLIKNYV